MTKLLSSLLKRTVTRKFYFQTVQNRSSSSGPLLISCKRQEYNYYYGQKYDTLEEVPLASKGWSHSKAKGDTFTILPLNEDRDEITFPFESLGINGEILQILVREGIKNATEFQDRAITTIRNSENVLLAAETGCGKTLAYVLPIIQDLLDHKVKSESLNTPSAVILLPNRELAYQVGEVARMLGEPVGIKTKIVVGGQTKRKMLNPEFGPIDILVGTPGALGKLSTVGIYKLHEVRYLVLDEADTLLDNSFIERVSLLTKRTTGSKVILVSATVPRKLPDFLAPIEVSLRHVVSSKIHKPLLNVTQKFLRITASSKPGHLLQIAKTNQDPLLIFTNKNATCNWTALFLRENGVPCSNINGEMNYQIRIEQWNRFVSDETRILVSTDIGSRGLNTIQVKHVLNYDFPLYAADYLHRVGRVGRLGSPTSCKVTNLISREAEIKLVQQIELAIRRNEPISNVDGNITRIVQQRVARVMRESV